MCPAFGICFADIFSGHPTRACIPQNTKTVELFVLARLAQEGNVSSFGSCIGVKDFDVTTNRILGEGLGAAACPHALQICSKQHTFFVAGKNEPCASLGNAPDWDWKELELIFRPPVL